MKRIVFALIALFTFIGYNSNAQTISVDIASISGTVGDIISVPVMVQPPLGTTVFYSQGSFTSSDPSVAEIVSAANSPAASPMGTQLINPGQINFQGNGQSFAGGLFMTIQVLIKAEGCADIKLEGGLNGGLTVEFMAGGVIYDDLATQFNVVDGKACGDPLPPCNPSDITIGPIFIQQGTSFDCSDYTVSVDPVVDCNGAQLNGFYTYVVVEANSGMTIAQVNNTQSTSIPVQLPYQSGYIVYVSYIYQDSNGDFQTVSATTNFFYSGCATPCDPNDLTLGPIYITEGTSFDCSDYTIGVPPISGCNGAQLNGFYTFVVTNSQGGTIAFVQNTQSTSIPVNLPYQDNFFVSVQYTYVDINGNFQTVNVGTDFFYAGCGCHLPIPSNLDCDLNFEKHGSYQTLSWDALLNAEGYEVELFYNDPACCAGVSGPTYRVVIDAGQSTSINRPANGTCFSWRVRATCLNGTQTDWSTSHCSCGPVTPGGLGHNKSLDQADNQPLTDGQFEMKTVPNPASNQVDIILSGVPVEAASTQADVLIYDISGKIIYQSEIAVGETKTVDISTFTPGVYLVKIIDNNAILSTEKLIVQ